MSGSRPWFPLFVDLSSSRVLFVGGGRIAARRVKALLPFAGEIAVVAPRLEASLAELAGAGEIVWRERPYDEADLEGAAIVLACTDDPAMNAAVHAACAARGIPCNVCSDHSLCDFYFPGIVRRGETVVGVNAGGKDHAGARRLRERIEELLSDNTTKEN